MAKYMKTEEGYQKIEVINANKMNMNNPVGTGSFSMGRKAGTTVGSNSHAEGNNTTASGPNSHAEGSNTAASGPNSHAEGINTAASGPNSHAEGINTAASGSNSHAEGNNTAASGPNSHAEGSRTTAFDFNSHAEGINTAASGSSSHAEGSSTTASGSNSHAEGSSTTASGSNSHAEGSSTTASGWYSHAEGSDTTASSLNSHAEGSNTTASGYASHAEGGGTTASGYASHAEGGDTVASTLNQHVSGSCNILDPSLEGPEFRGRYIHIVGNGLNKNSRSNAHTLDWSGNAWFAGDVYVGSTSGTNKDDGSKKLATEDYVNNNVDNTLTQPGQAADASEVGARLSSLSEEMLTEESDPTVPAWAKQPAKPTYTAGEVGAQPETLIVSYQGSGIASHSHSEINEHIQKGGNVVMMDDDVKYDYIQGDNEEAVFRHVNYINNELLEVVDAYIYADKTVEIDRLVYKIPTKPEDISAQPVGSYLESTELTTAINTALAQAKASGEFDGAGGKSAYAYAVEGGYTGTEAEFAAKLAAEKFANPNALTFTGAVTGTYDGSEPVEINIPSGGGGSSGNDTIDILMDVTVEEAVAAVTVTLDNPRAYKELYIQTVIYGEESNSSANAMFLRVNNTATQGSTGAIAWIPQIENATSATVKSYGVAFVKLLDDCSFYYCYGSKSANARTPNASYGEMNTLANRETVISTLKFQSVNQWTKFGVGSTIKVYGVRS